VRGCVCVRVGVWVDGWVAIESNVIQAKACWKHAVTHDNTAIGILAGGLPSCAEGASVWPERERAVWHHVYSVLRKSSAAARLVEQCQAVSECNRTVAPVCLHVEAPCWDSSRGSGKSLVVAVVVLYHC